LLAAAVIGGIALEGCKKYEEGPSLSLRSRKERVANTWKIDKYIVNNEDQTAAYTSNFPNYQLVLNKEGGASLNVGSNTGVFTGTWALTNDDEELVITLTSVGITQTTTSTILKLKEKELWLKNFGNANDPTDDTETHFAPVE
jgi:hypothetical protein